MSSVDTSNLDALGSGNSGYEKVKGAISVRTEVLERFASPFADKDLSPFDQESRSTVTIVAPEFTSLCPMTGQPDFAVIVIQYQPSKWCVESKSLKLYLSSFRNVGEFHESCVQRISTDLIRLLDPVSINVRGEFTPRGGIKFWPEVVYYQPI